MLMHLWLTADCSFQDHPRSRSNNSLSNTAPGGPAGIGRATGATRSPLPGRTHASARSRAIASLSASPPEPLPSAPAPVGNTPTDSSFRSPAPAPIDTPKIAEPPQAYRRNPAPNNPIPPPNDQAPPIIIPTGTAPRRLRRAHL